MSSTEWLSGSSSSWHLSSGNLHTGPLNTAAEKVSWSEEGMQIYILHENHMNMQWPIAHVLAGLNLLVLSKIGLEYPTGKLVFNTVPTS